jgi:receptor expression-enhancing protein 5/6
VFKKKRKKEKRKMVAVNVAELKKIVDAVELKLVGRAPQLKAFTQMTGFPAIYLVLGAGFLFFTLLILLSGLRALVHLVAYIYPGWQSLKALNSENRNDDTLWLSYWVIYGFFTVFESVTDLLLHRIPLYEFVKMGFYVYLYEMRGALTVYEHVLRPLVIKAESFRAHGKIKVEVTEQQQNQPGYADRTANVASAQGSINVQSYGNQAYNTAGTTSTSRNTNTRKLD